MNLLSIYTDLEIKTISVLILNISLISMGFLYPSKHILQIGIFGQSNLELFVSDLALAIKAQGMVYLHLLKFGPLFECNQNLNLKVVI